MGSGLATVLPPSFRFAASEVLQHRALSGFVLSGSAPSSSNDTGVSTAWPTPTVVALVRAGQSVVIFPEGHLARAPWLRLFHLGAFVVAAQAGATVVPIAVRGTRTILRPEHRFPRRRAIDIAIGQPVEPTGTDWAAAIELQRAARDAFLRLSGEPDVE